MSVSENWSRCWSGAAYDPERVPHQVLLELEHRRVLRLGFEVLENPEEDRLEEADVVLDDSGEEAFEAVEVVLVRAG